jgi:hypothetical protein
MLSVVDKFKSLLPPKKKLSPSGWTSFNAPCCQHRGHAPDKRKRAGVRFDSGIVYNCFNCKFSTGWQPGSPIGEKMKSLCRWLGANDDDVNELIFEALRTEDVSSNVKEKEYTVDFTEKELPEGSMSLANWANSDYWEEVSDLIEPIVEYLADRGHDPFNGKFYWSPAPGYADRVIIPFRWGSKIVGNTARKITNSKPKYLSDQQPNFVFNFDSQLEEQKYVFVVEGPFDALSINGVALLSNEISDHQARIINSIGAEVIVIPDQDKAGINLVKRAIDLGWSVAFPNWDNDTKDCSDAVKKYGKLFVVVDAIKTKEQGEIKITMALKNFEKKLELYYNKL